MDNSTALNGPEALAQLVFTAICGAEADDETKQRAQEYWATIVISPWRDNQEAHTIERGQKFYAQLAELRESGSLFSQWRAHFNDQFQPRNESVAKEFLSHCFQAILHKPKIYYNFICQQQSLNDNHVMDFPIIHPITVEFWTLYSTISGVGEIDVEGVKTDLPKGIIALVPPGCECTVARHQQHKIWQFDWLTFRSRPEWFELMDWAFSLDQPMILSLDNSEELSQLSTHLAELQSTTYQRADINERLCHNLIENILIRLRRFNELNNRPAPSDQRLGEVVNYVLARYCNQLSLEDIARHVNLSASRLNALFSQHYGTSLIKWRDRMRMQKAQELLSHTNMAINLIANRVGYDDPLYFSRRYRKQFGLSPSESRKTAN